MGNDAKSGTQQGPRNTYLAGFSLERTTGFEPATLTLATSFAITSLPATAYIYQCFTGLLTYRS